MKNKKANFSYEKFSCFPKPLRFCKRGQFFALYLFVLTLFMCGLSFVIYSIQQEDMENTIVSPMPVLQLQDEQELFEISEGVLIKNSVCEFKYRDYNQDLSEEIKQQILYRYYGELFAFLFADTYKTSTDGGDLELLASFYSVSQSGKNVVVKRRAKINRNLIPLEIKGKNNFPVKLEWVFEKTYNINLKDCS